MCFVLSCLKKRQLKGDDGMHFASLSWKEASNLCDKYLAVLPIGSVEAHGPVGPLGTDYLIPSAIAEELEKRMTGQVLLLPTLPYGCSPFLAGFPGTIDVGFQPLLSVLNGIADGVMGCGVRKILFVNGHGGNIPSLDHAALHVYKRGGQAARIDWWTLSGQLNKEWLAGHGGGIETSVAMAIRPDWVRIEGMFKREHAHFTEALKNIHIHEVAFGKGTVSMVRDVVDSIPSGSAGYDDAPEKACKETGERVLSAVIDYVHAFAEEFLKVDLDKVRS